MHFPSSNKPGRAWNRSPIAQTSASWQPSKWITVVCLQSLTCIPIDFWMFPLQMSFSFLTQECKDFPVRGMQIARANLSSGLIIFCHFHLDLSGCCESAHSPLCDPPQDIRWLMSSGLISSPHLFHCLGGFDVSGLASYQTTLNKSTHTGVSLERKEGYNSWSFRPWSFYLFCSKPFTTVITIFGDFPVLFF